MAGGWLDRPFGKTEPSLIIRRPLNVAVLPLGSVGKLLGHIYALISLTVDPVVAVDIALFWRG